MKNEKNFNANQKLINSDSYKEKHGSIHDARNRSIIKNAQTKLDLFIPDYLDISISIKENMSFIITCLDNDLYDMAKDLTNKVYILIQKQQNEKNRK